MSLPDSLQKITNHLTASIPNRFEVHKFENDLGILAGQSFAETTDGSESHFNHSTEHVGNISSPTTDNLSIQSTIHSHCFSQNTVFQPMTFDPLFRENTSLLRDPSSLTIVSDEDVSEMSMNQDSGGKLTLKLSKSDPNLSKSSTFHLPKLSKLLSNSLMTQKVSSSLMFRKSIFGSFRSLSKSQQSVASSTRKSSIVHLHQIDPFYSTVESSPSRAANPGTSSLLRDTGIDHIGSTVEDRRFLEKLHQPARRSKQIQKIFGAVGSKRRATFHSTATEDLQSDAKSLDRISSTATEDLQSAAKSLDRISSGTEQFKEALGDRRGTCYFDAPSLNDVRSVQSFIKDRDRMYSSSQSLRKRRKFKRNKKKKKNIIFNHVIPHRKPKPASLFDKIISAVSKCTV